MKKRIAIIHGPMITGGTGKALINLFHYMDFSKYDVTLWLNNDEGELIPQVDPRVKIRYYGDELAFVYNKYFGLLWKKRKIFPVVQSLFFEMLYKICKKDKQHSPYYKMKSRLVRKREKYDVVVLYQALPFSLLNIALGLFQSPHYIAWIHGDHIDPPTQQEIAEYLALYKEYHEIVFVSEAVKKIHAARYPQLQEKFRVIYNLQDLSSIRKLAQEPLDVPFERSTLVTVGRLAPEKGQDMVPEIARNLLDIGYRFTWYLVGDGPTRPMIENLIRQYHVEDTVILTGTKSNPYPCIKNCTLYVQPSYHEGFCVTTFEAKILGTPVVVTDVPGMREQFTDETACFAEPTVVSLTAAIVKALEDPNKYRTQDAVTENFNFQELQKIYQLLDEPVSQV